MAPSLLEFAGSLLEYRYLCAWHYYARLSPAGRSPHCAIVVCGRAGDLAQSAEDSYSILELSVLQVPLVIMARPLMDQLKFGFNILFVTLDAFLVALMVNWIRPKELT